MADSAQNLVTSIRMFVAENLAPRRGVTEVQDDDSLIEQGIVDSLGIFTLVAFLEEEFGIEIGTDEVTPENFATVNTIERFVQTKRSG